MAREDVLDSVQRVAAVLRACASKASGMSVREVAESVGLSKSAVHRLMVSLASVDLLRYDMGRQRYSLGLGILELSSQFPAQSDVVATMAPHLRQLRDLVNETVCLHMAVEDKGRIVLAQYESSHEFRFVTAVGRLTPLHVGSGRAILATLSPDELDNYLRHAELTAYTTRTVTNPEVLRELIEDVKHEGTLVSRGEFSAGALSIAAPVAALHQPRLAISIFAPEVRIQDGQIEVLREHVRITAERCASDLDRLARGADGMTS